MKKKLLPISLLCLVGMILAGCGGNKSSSSQGSGSSSGEPSSVVPSSSSVTPVPSSSSSVAPSSSSSSSVAPSSSSSSAPSSSSSSTPSSSSSSVAPQPVAVTGVALDKSAANVILGQTLQLTATVAPENADNKEVTWSSDDEDVASVSRTGLVTANAVGQAKITVKTREGNFKAECVITVVKEIEKVEITNKAAFEGFIVDDVESLNVSVTPADNVTALLAAGALKVTSSDPTVASVVGLTVTGLKVGKATIGIELFGKTDSFELNVADAIPGEKYTIANALVKGFEEAPWNGTAGGGSNITATCFELTGKVLAVSPNGATAFDIILDDGTQAVYLQFTKAADEVSPVAVGDYATVTCKFTNYYGLMEGVSKKAEDEKTSPKIPLKDIVKVAAPETPITPFLNEAENMDAAAYEAYYNVCKTNGTKDAAGATYTSLKRAKLAITYHDDPANSNFKYVIDGTDGKYGLEIYQSDLKDEPFEGQKSTVEVFLISCNTGKSKSNSILIEQTPLAPTAVAIDQEAQVIVHGNTLQMSYTTTPAGSYARDVVWSSSDVEAATIDPSGLLTGVYEGSGTKATNVKVTLGQGEAAVESPVVAINVFGETVHATAASLNKTTMELVEGQNAQLSASTTPEMVSDKAVWSSSAEDIVSVDQKGALKALKAGNAVITVKYNDSVSAECAVTVKKLAADTNYVGAEIDTIGVLVGKNGKNGMIDDGTGGIFAYASANISANVGDLVRVSGKTKNYNGGIEIDGAKIEAAPEGSPAVTPINATPISEAEVAAELAARLADSNYVVRGKKVSLRTGVIGGSGNYLTWSYGESLMETSISTGGMNAGSIYDIEGYLVNFYKDTKVTPNLNYLCICVTSATKVTLTPTSVSLNKESLELDEGKSETLTATIAPEGAEGTVVWSSSAEGVAIVDQNGKVTAVAAGDAVITAKVGELTATCNVKVNAPAGGPKEFVSAAKYTFTNTKSSTAVTDGATIKGWFTKQSGEDIVTSISDASTVYPGANGGSGDTAWEAGNFLKIGKSSGGGTLTLNLSKEVSKMVVKGYAWKNTLNFLVNDAKVTGALASNIANKTNVEAGNAGSFEIEFAASNKLVLATENTAICITEIEFFEEKSVAPSEISQPVGNFSGNIVSASDSSNLFTTIALANEKAYVEVGSLIKTTTTYTFNKTSGLVTIDLGAYGTFKATFDEANNKLINCGIEGAAAAYISNNNSIELGGAADFWNCDGSTDELRTQFQRRYRANGASSWSVDNMESHTDRIVSDQTNFVAGTGAMSIRPYSGSGNAVGLSLLNDFETAKAFKNIGFWVYNSSDTDITFRTWVYTSKGLSGANEIGAMVAKANGWTYCRMGFSYSIYNFNISNWNGSANALVYDNICLF